eukprot:3596276-Ditylum_brightwellii.AAC.1
MQRMNKQYDEHIDMTKPSKQNEQPRELCMEKEQHCSEPRGTMPKTFLPSVITPDPCELRDKGGPEPQSSCEKSKVRQRGKENVCQRKEVRQFIHINQGCKLILKSHGRQ